MGSAMDGYKPWLKHLEVKALNEPKMTLAANWFRPEFNNVVFIQADVNEAIWELAVRVCRNKPKTCHICLVCLLP